MRNIFNHGPRFAALLLFCPALVFVVSLFWRIGQAPAQVQTYSYSGLAFDVSWCQANYPMPPPTCPASSITGSVTFAVSAGYTGSRNKSNILAYDFSAGGIGSVGTGDYFNPSDAQIFYFNNGQIYNWDFDIYSNVSSSPPYTDIVSHALGSPVSENDYAVRSDGIGNPAAIGFTHVPATGTWTNGKAFGIACGNQPARSRAANRLTSAAATFSIKSPTTKQPGRTS